jgi:hypothetical protein
MGADFFRFNVLQRAAGLKTRLQNKKGSAAKSRLPLKSILVVCFEKNTRGLDDDQRFEYW